MSWRGEAQVCRGLLGDVVWCGVGLRVGERDGKGKGGFDLEYRAEMALI